MSFPWISLSPRAGNSRRASVTSRSRSARVLRQEALEFLEERTLLSLSSTQWTSIGPTGIDTSTAGVPVIYGQGGLTTGRVTAVAADPTNPGTIYVGSPGGGVWKTTDGGVDWSTTTDSQANLVIGSIAVAPNLPTTIYAGTGDAETGTGINAADAYAGDGILKSTDGGQTWTLVGKQFAGATIGKIVVDPTNANNLFAAVSTNAVDGFGSVIAGIYHSTDGGQSWTDMGFSSAFVSTDAITDLVINPKNPTILYAALGSPTSATTEQYNGVYESVNGARLRSGGQFHHPVPRRPPVPPPPMSGGSRWRSRRATPWSCSRGLRPRQERRRPLSCRPMAARHGPT